MSQRRQPGTPGPRWRSLRVATKMGGAALAATSVETARHSDDVELITGAMCEHLEVPEPEREGVLAAARLHDIGKMALPAGVLDKPGELNAEEWRLVRQHPVIGEQILGAVNELTEVAKLVRHSHERWDGDGYPDGLEGEQIPVGSRIVFCADAFHAIRSDRPYRNGTSAERALAEVRRNSGTQFDPRVVEALTDVVRQLRIAPEREGNPSPRLVALLLALTLGLGGSAVARTDVLEDISRSDAGPRRTALLPPIPCESAACSLGPVLFEPTTAFASSAAKTETNPGAGAPGFKPGQEGGGQVTDKQGAASPGAGADEGGPGSSGDAGSGGGSSGAAGNGNGGSSGGSGTGSPGKSGSAHGRGGGSGKSGSGKSGNSGGSGGSGNATGQQSDAPGNSGSAPGHNK